METVPEIARQVPAVVEEGEAAAVVVMEMHHQKCPVQSRNIHRISDYQKSPFHTRNKMA